MQAAFMQKGDECTRVSFDSFEVFGWDSTLISCFFHKKFIDSWKPGMEWGPKNAKAREEWIKNEADYQMERLFEKQN